MAIHSRVCVCVFLVALLPAFASGIRPFRVPKNLFVQGTSPDTIPDGVSVIRRPAREAEEPEFESPQERAEVLHGRFRRDSSESSGPQEPEKSTVSLSLYFKFVT